MNTTFNSTFATLVSKEGVQSTFAGHGTGYGASYFVIDNVSIGSATRAKINRAVSAAGCASSEEAWEIAKGFIRACDRSAAILERACFIGVEDDSENE